MVSQNAMDRRDVFRTFSNIYDEAFCEKVYGFQPLKLVSAIFYQIFIFDQMIALQKLWKMFFISSK